MFHSNMLTCWKLAWEFLKQLTYEEEMQMDIFRYSQGVSVLKNVTMSEEAADAIQRSIYSYLKQ